MLTGCLPAPAPPAEAEPVASLDNNADIIFAFTIKAGSKHPAYTFHRNFMDVRLRSTRSHFNVGDFMKLLDIEQSFPEGRLVLPCGIRTPSVTNSRKIPALPNRLLNN